MKNQPRLAITAILAAAVLAGIFAMVTTSIKINAEEDYGASSETETEHKNKQSAAASGLNVDVHNCIENNIDVIETEPFSQGNTNPDCSDIIIPISPSP